MIFYNLNNTICNHKTMVEIWRKQNSCSVQKMFLWTFLKNEVIYQYSIGLLWYEVLGNAISCVVERIQQMELINSKQKILGVTIDNKLKCKSHMKELYKKNLSNYLNDFEKKLVFNSIVKSQFSCHWGFLFQSRFLCQHFMFLQSSGDIFGCFYSYLL